ncbi:MAG: class I SAM-dependent methyltransferase, partial [bacterium]|nr:class I SAM-dependent methyltransferase [bacterium]
LPIEKEELGNTAGKSLLHLQCHFGLDTLSWARLGAAVTGVDFSERSIQMARSISGELDIPANFICSDIYELPKVLAKTFDIVFTSYGVLLWLPDLDKWASVVSRFLKPGGTFYMVELHPFLNILDTEKDALPLTVRYPYFHSPTPEKWEAEGSYADRDAVLEYPSYEWSHSMGDIINALLSAGLQIEFLHEFPYCCYARFPFMERGEDGLWRMNTKDQIPMMFSIKAGKR